MTPWIYEDDAAPVAKWGLANGQESVMLDIPDGDAQNYDPDEPDAIGTDDWDGEMMIFQGPGSRALAIRWLKAALASVEALPEVEGE